MNARPQEDVIALGSYNIDVGEIERMWRFLSLCPRRKEAGDLLVPLCLSASHVALASVRMEPTPMLLGHAAGLAAAQAARRGVAVQDVDVETPQGDLRDAGQVLAL